MREGIVLFLLIIFGIEDVRKKSLSLPLLVAAFGLMVFSRFLFGNLAEGAAGVGSGILVWLIGEFARGDWKRRWIFTDDNRGITRILGKYGTLFNRFVFLCILLGRCFNFAKERAGASGSLRAFSCRCAAISYFGFAWMNERGNQR